jgi:tRNA-2-methylthio-N6-dimethylallyladenosine synthase
VRRLASLGVKEVTLLGQNITQYGQDLDSINLAMLLKELEEIEGLRRVRFITSHPAFVSKDLIFAVRDLQKPCRHFHLPLQSGSDKVLRLMRRGYTTELFARLVDKIREAIPDASITTDLIVGFPGEGEEDFQETLLFLSRLQLDAVFGFQFSKRPGTKAEGLPNQVPQDVKRRRLQEVFSLQRGITLKKNKALCGEVQDVMVEGDNPKNPNEYMGRTEQNKVVVFPKKRVFSKGEIVQIRISEAGLWSLRGQIEG